MCFFFRRVLPRRDPKHPASSTSAQIASVATLPLVAQRYDLLRRSLLVLYAAAKAAVLNATVSLAKDLAGTGITVNSVSPGPILTPAGERFFRDVAKQQGLGRGMAGDRAAGGEEPRAAPQWVLDMPNPCS